MQEEQELPKGWIELGLGSLLKFNYGKALKGNNRNEDGPFDVFGSSGAVGKHDAALVEEPCLIIGRKGNVGSVFLSTKPCWPIDTAYFVITPQNTELQFAYYLLKHLQLGRLDKSTAIPGLNRDDAYKHKIKLPPLPEQRRIVAKLEELFSRLDAGVAAVRQSQQLLKRYRQSVLHAAVTGALTSAWRTAHPAPAETGAALLARIRAERRGQWEAAQQAKHGGQLPLNGAWKNKYQEPAAVDTTELPELPEGWVWVSPEEIASQDKYSLAIGPFGSNLKVPDYREEGVPLVFVREIKSGKFGGPRTKFVTPHKAEELRAHQITKGDILITKMGEPPGDACLYPENRPDAVITADCIKWTLDQNLKHKSFFVYAINSHVIKVQIAFITQGVAQQKVSLGRFKTIGIPLPPLTEQAEIVAEAERRLSTIDALELTLTAELKRAERLRQSLLHRAFTGRLVPQDATDEPAGELLARTSPPGPLSSGRGGAKAAAAAADSEAPAESGKRRGRPRKVAAAADEAAPEVAEVETAALVDSKGQLGLRL